MKSRLPPPFSFTLHLRILSCWCKENPFRKGFQVEVKLRFIFSIFNTIHAVGVYQYFSHSRLLSLSFSHLSPPPQPTPIMGIIKEGRRIGETFPKCYQFCNNTVSSALCEKEQTLKLTILSNVPMCLYRCVLQTNECRSRQTSCQKG